MSSRIVVLTEGNTSPLMAKTATCVIRYRPGEVVAILDSTRPNETSQALLGVGGDIHWRHECTDGIFDQQADGDVCRERARDRRG